MRRSVRKHHHLISILACSLLKPDFLLIRQDPRDAGEDYKSALLGFQYGLVPSINSLESVYNFQVSRTMWDFMEKDLKHVLFVQDKPWVYAHLLGLKKKLGKENFPLLQQSFFQNHRDIVSFKILKEFFRNPGVRNFISHLPEFRVNPKI